MKKFTTGLIGLAATLALGAAALAAPQTDEGTRKLSAQINADAVVASRLSSEEIAVYLAAAYAGEESCVEITGPFGQCIALVCTDQFGNRELRDCGDN